MQLGTGGGLSGVAERDPPFQEVPERVGGRLSLADSSWPVAIRRSWSANRSSRTCRVSVGITGKAAEGEAPSRVGPKRAEPGRQRLVQGRRHQRDPRAPVFSSTSAET